VTFRGGQSGSETYGANDNQYHRISVREIKSAAAHLVEQKQHSNRDDDSGAHQTADGAAPARTTDSITHRSSSPKIRPQKPRLQPPRYSIR
jgi:hypothetical protein